MQSPRCPGMRTTVALHTIQRRSGSITGYEASVEGALCSALKSIKALRTIRERLVWFVCAYSFNQVTIEGSQLMLKLVTGGANCFFAMPSHLQSPIKYLIIKTF